MYTAILLPSAVDSAHTSSSASNIDSNCQTEGTRTVELRVGTCVAYIWSRRIGTAHNYCSLLYLWFVTSNALSEFMANGEFGSELEELECVLIYYLGQAIYPKCLELM